LTQSGRYAFGPALRETILRNVAAFDVRLVEDAALRHAAVAFVVVKSEVDDSACFLLTRRPNRMRRHGGQLALPGGRMDEGETPIVTALRETHEELGLELDPADVIGVLDDYPTRSGWRMTPVIVWGGPARELMPDPQEVERVFRVPLAELDSAVVPHLKDGPKGPRTVLSAPLPTLNDHVHAPTAAILYQFREVALRGLATRVAHFDQPAFAWK
jgi:8-oxo-dGTP pyrophosphatase MutT (NUDIX family)